MAAGVPGCWLLLHTGQQTTAERSRADKGAAPGAGVSGGLLSCSMWSELASLQVPQEMSSQVHCVLSACGFLSVLPLGARGREAEFSFGSVLGKPGPVHLIQGRGPLISQGGSPSLIPVWPGLPCCQLHAYFRVHVCLFPLLPILLIHVSKS